ncbi:MAG: hypothetical protein HZC01_03215 [Candidatus Kerfeldbacteria bacterium]|nr:hypothetical protein [Candidatus Kerfeldbacteria bacterium]
MRIIGKIVLVLVLLSLIMPFVKTACDLTLLNNLEQYHAPMCHLEDLSQTFGHLRQFQQFNAAVVEPMNLMLLLILFIAAVSISMTARVRQALMLPADEYALWSGHMKPWDPLRFAFSHGRLRRVDYE